mgnify:CR=1 FL=1
MKQKGQKSKWFQGGSLYSIIILLGVVGVFFFFAYFVIPTVAPSTYRAGGSVGAADMPPEDIVPKPVVFVATHVKTPEPLKAIYMSSWVAGTSRIREPLVQLIEDTELNAIVIDIKDYTGRISFNPEDPTLMAIGSGENRISDVKEFIQSLHEKNIYVIGRIAVFQDPYFVKLHPEASVKKESDKTTAWKDYKGISWMDAGSKEVWEYTVEIGNEAYRVGFDELNFDYIRFPSDGNMRDIYYPHSDGKNKSEVLEEFFSYLHDAFGPKKIPISADLFGMTTTNTDDLNIGQVLEKALPYFDFIAPMVYPSHYPPGFMGFKNPAAKPYEVVFHSMEKAAERASTTPLKLRPWLQDFDLGATYTADMVRAQMKATYDAGLTSWMLWDASNRYTKDALLPESIGPGASAE